MANRLPPLAPVLNDGVYAFVSVSSDTDLSHISSIGMFREREGMTLIVSEDVAKRAGLEVRFRAAWITLMAETDLAAVGVTAAVSQALQVASIPCNVIAAVHHDHIFVPVDRAHDALAVLSAI